MSNYRFGITTIGFWLVLVVCVFLMEGMNFLNSGGSIPFNEAELIVVSLAVGIGALVYYLIEKKTNKSKISWGILPIFLILLFTGIFGIWYSPSSYTINGVTFDYSVELLKKITWTVQIVLGLFVMYLAFGIFSKRILQVKSLAIVLWCFVLAGFVTIGYSLATEFNSYKAIFEGDIANITSIKSLFINENNYGQMLLLSFCALITLDAIKSRWWHFIFFVILYAAAIFSTSYTSLLIMSFIFNFYIIYLYFKTIRKHPYRNTILLVLYFSLLVGIICCYVFLDFSQFEIIKNLEKFVTDKILDKDYLTFSGRQQVWKNALASLQTPLDFVFGKGYGNFNEVYHDYMAALNPNSNLTAVDSAYVSMLGSFGILGLFSYISGIFALFGIGIFCLVKKRVKIVFPSLILLLALCIYGGFETLILFLPNTAGILPFVIIALPILIEFNNVRRKRVIETSLMTSHVQLDVLPFSNKMIVQTASMILSCLVLVCGLNFCFLSQFYYANLIIFIILVLLFLFYPYMLSVWYRSYNHNLIIFRSVTLTLLLFIGPFALVIPIIVYMQNFDYIFLMLFYLVGFVILLSIELIFTLSITKDAKQMVRLILRYGIKPNIICFLLGVLIFAPTLFLLDTIFSFSVFFALMTLLVVAMLYLLGLYFLPNFGLCKQHYKIIINQINNRYILKQKMLFVLNKIN